MIRANRFIPALIASVGLIFMASCSNSSPTSTKESQTPQPPSAKTMAMDFSIFTTQQPDSNAAGDRNNYEQAAESIDQIQAVMNRNINLALDAFASADTADAEEIEEGKWQWKFSNDVGDQERRLNYGFRLVAQQQSDSKLKWDLFLSSPALPNTSPVENNEKLFISGNSNKEVTEGEWTYYSFGSINQPQQKMAKLDWEIDGNEDVDIELELIAGNNFSGSVMDYQTKGPVRTIELDVSGDDQETTIEFNTETHAGFIISPDYNNGQKACWGPDFEDIACPES